MQLLQTLAARGLLSDSDRARAAEAIKAAPEFPPHQILVDKGFIKEDTLLPVLAEEFGLELIDLSHAVIAPDVLTAMPQKLVHRKNLMPVARHNGTLVVATGDPFDAYALDELQTLTGLHVMPVLAPPREIARLNMAEKRLPQDGRIKMKVQGREIDVRVSIIPMVHGEGIVMRLLDKGRMAFNLKTCGMLPDVYGTFKQLIDRPHGIVLVTGPTGSGKSTTLYPS